MDIEGSDSADDRSPSPSSRTEARDAELVRLRERVAFYQSFDGLIQENITRSSVLLKEAMDVREHASMQIASVQADLQRLKEADRSRYRTLFAAMLDELTTLQGQAERLARRLSDALDEIESPQGAVLDSATIGDLAGGDISPLALETGGASTAPESSPTPAIGDDDGGLLADSALAPAPDAPPADRSHMGTERAVAPDRPAEASIQAPPVAQAGTVVLVHGVPRATLALSLKRFLEELPYVGSVEPREFAEGILRLEVSGDRPLAFEDLRTWPDGVGLEPIHVRQDLVEVRLTS